MAQALRNTDWMVPEKRPAPRATRSRARSVHRPAAALWQRPIPLTLLILGAVCVVMLFIRCSDCIAQRDLRSQSLRTELAQLDRECVQLNLELKRMAAEPHLSTIASAQGLVLPAPGQIHFARATADFPQSAVAQAAPAQPKRTVLASVQGFWQRLMPTSTAYGQN